MYYTLLNGVIEYCTLHNGVISLTLGYMQKYDPILGTLEVENSCKPSTKWHNALTLALDVQNVWKL